MKHLDDNICYDSILGRLWEEGCGSFSLLHSRSIVQCCTHKHELTEVKYLFNICKICDISEASKNTTSKLH